MGPFPVDEVERALHLVQEFDPAGVAAGIKPSGRKDLALIYSTAPARAAAARSATRTKPRSRIRRF